VTDSVLAPVRPQFRALATALMPETRTLDGVAWQRTEAVIDAMLEDRPPQTRRQVGRFIRLANVLPVIRYGRTFTELSQSRQARVVDALESAPFLSVRRGVWGLRTLVSMGVYGQDPTGSARPTWSDRPRSRRARHRKPTPNSTPRFDA
jgi:hypothetical protein